MASHPIRAVQDAFDERQRTFKTQQALSKSKGDKKVQAASAERLRSANGAGVVGGSSHSNPTGFNLNAQDILTGKTIVETNELLAAYDLIDILRRARARGDLAYTFPDNIVDLACQYVRNRRQQLATAVPTSQLPVGSSILLSQLLGGLSEVGVEKKTDEAPASEEEKKSPDDVVGVKKWACDAIGKAVDKEMLKDPQKLDEYIKALKEELSGKENMEQLWSLMIICQRDWFLPPSNKAYEKLCKAYEQMIDLISDDPKDVYANKWKKTIDYTYKWMKRLIKECIEGKPSSPDQTQTALAPLIYALRKMLKKSLEQTEEFPLILDYSNFSGKATLKFDDGATYQGEIRNGLADGQGTLINGVSDEIYVGKFEGKQIPGQGMIIAHGNVYKGELKNSRLNGYGIFIIPNRMIHEGKWKNHQKHGPGRTIFSDGRVYVGLWEEGKRHGLSRLRLPSGYEFDVRYEEGVIAQAFSCTAPSKGCENKDDSTVAASAAQMGDEVKKWTYDEIKNAVIGAKKKKLSEILKDPKNLEIYFEGLENEFSGKTIKEHRDHINEIVTSYKRRMIDSADMKKLHDEHMEGPATDIYNHTNTVKEAQILAIPCNYLHLKELLELYVKT